MDPMLSDADQNRLLGLGEKPLEFVPSFVAIRAGYVFPTGTGCSSPSIRLVSMERSFRPFFQDSHKITRYLEQQSMSYSSSEH